MILDLRIVRDRNDRFRLYVEGEEIARDLDAVELQGRVNVAISRRVAAPSVYPEPVPGSILAEALARTQRDRDSNPPPPREDDPLGAAYDRDHGI